MLITSVSVLLEISVMLAIFAGFILLIHLLFPFHMRTIKYYVLAALLVCFFLPFLNEIARWNDDQGIELIKFFAYSLLFILLQLFIITGANCQLTKLKKNLVLTIFCLAIALWSIDITIYLQTIFYAKQDQVSLVLGGFIALAMCLSIGVLSFYLFYFSYRYATSLFYGLLTVISFYYFYNSFYYAAQLDWISIVFEPLNQIFRHTHLNGDMNNKIQWADYQSSLIALLMLLAFDYFAIKQNWFGKLIGKYS